MRVARATCRCARLGLGHPEEGWPRKQGLASGGCARRRCDEEGPVRSSRGGVLGKEEGVLEVG
jgi:hypothetical protein